VGRKSCCEFYFLVFWQVERFDCAHLVTCKCAIKRIELIACKFVRLIASTASKFECTLVICILKHDVNIVY
jgi:hypothetical protein